MHFNHVFSMQPRAGKHLGAHVTIQASHPIFQMDHLNVPSNCPPIFVLVIAPLVFAPEPFKVYLRALDLVTVVQVGH